MEFIDDVDDEFARRLPLMAAGRTFEPVALNWTAGGTDVDFGSLSRQLLGFGTERGMSTLFGHEVIDLDQSPTGGLGGEGRQPAHWPEAQSCRQIRLRRLCWRHAAAAEVGHEGGQRASAGFPVSSSGCAPTSRTSPAPTTPGVRPAAAGRPADVDAAPGHPGDQRQDWLLFGPFAGWSPKFLKAAGHRPAAVGQTEQPGLDDRGGADRVAAATLHHRRAADVRDDRVETLRQFAPPRRTRTGRSTSPVSACR